MKKDNHELNIEIIKKADKIYLRELQLFFDKVDNVKDEELKRDILHQMHLCEQRIIKICEEILTKGD